MHLWTLCTFPTSPSFTWSTLELWMAGCDLSRISVICGHHFDGASPLYDSHSLNVIGILWRRFTRIEASDLVSNPNFDTYITTKVALKVGNNYVLQPKHRFCHSKAFKCNSLVEGEKISTINIVRFRRAYVTPKGQMKFVTLYISTEIGYAMIFMSSWYHCAH